jgi:integrase
MEILAKYTNKDGHIDILRTVKSHHSLMQQTNRALRKLGDVKRVGFGGRKVFSPMFPNLTTYWARHTWATIAAELDIPNETIAAALGHNYGNRTTAIYINFNQKKVDEANRKVIDYVLHGKR